MTRELFRKSKKKKGFIYLCEVENGYFIRYADATEYTPCKKWKYGKTINLQKRMSMYGPTYKLLHFWEVDHLPLREQLIRWDYEITEDREWQGVDSRNEHVEFDCFKIVEYYATAKLTLTKEYGNYQVNIENEKECPHFFTTKSVCDSILLSIVKM